MHPRLRPLLLATGALLATAHHAAAQFVELVTEANVTLQASLSTTITKPTDTGTSTETVVTRLPHAQLLEELRTSGVIADATVQNWSLVAVRNASADMKLVDASFYLYAIKTDPTTKAVTNRVRIPAEKFSSVAYGSAYRYTERHQGQYVHSSTGSITSHVSYDYRPVFSTANGTYTITGSESAGFAKINFVAKDVSDGFESFYFFISSLSASTRGGFNATLGQTNTVGLINLTISVGASKLVPADLYPEVDSFRSPSADMNAAN